ncbi:multimerin-1-like [Daphnia pulicaria]|uniref:multimerin-1-like n=1 Tax=Daphnia pulicaria TaxID=35523 RepID=UPI001EE9E978|nr:multimerin-1-like [Daphnia pulicaria]XP_046645899.1 multimerin-1-like [Daphnia pulicaria]
MRPVTISITFFAVLTTLATTSTASNEQIDLATIKSAIQKLEKESKSLQDLVGKMDLKETSDRLSTNSELLEETKAEIKNLKKELTETKGVAEKLKMELADTKKELLKISQDLTITKSNLLNQLNGFQTDTNKELNVVNTTIRHLAKEIKDISVGFENKHSALSSELQVTAANITQDLHETNLKIDITTSVMLKFAESSQRSAAEANIALENLTEELQGKLEANKQELEEVKIKVGNLTTDLKARTSEIVDIGHIPTSCSDLQQIGYKTNGLFSVMGNTSVETVYCNFHAKENDLQKWIGWNDIKSVPTYFYATRITPFSTIRTPIPFDLAKVNMGNAMELASGKFRAPRSGIYFFSFTGHALFPQSVSEVELAVSLYLNGNRVGWAEVEETNTSDGQFSPLTLQSTINLKAGDQIWLQIVSISEGTVLFNARNHYTHFTGWMLEEDIVASL